MSLTQPASAVLEALTIWLGTRGESGCKPPVAGADSLGQNIKNVMKRIRLDGTAHHHPPDTRPPTDLVEVGLGMGWELGFGLDRVSGCLRFLGIE